MGSRAETGTVACAVLGALVLVPWNTTASLQARNSAQIPAAMVRRCAQKLMKQIRSSRPVRFQERTDATWGSEIREVMLTREGRVDRLIAIGDQPLSSAERTKEVARLSALFQESVAQPVAQEQDKEKERRMKLVAAIPQAFSYQLSAASEPGNQELTFSPAKSFHPQNRETRVYKGMRGVMQLDTRSEQLLRVDGEIFRNVPFGWGILGKLHRGGHFCIEQREVLPGRWEITTMDFDFTYTVFFFSTSHYVRHTSNAGYALIDPDTRLKDAVRQLLAEPSRPLPRDSFAGHCASSASAVNDRAERQSGSMENSGWPADRFPFFFAGSPVLGHTFPALFRQIRRWQDALGNSAQMAKADGKRGFR